MENPKPIEHQKTTRRDFCAQALTFVTVASLLEGCGSKGNPNNPGGGGGGGGTNVPPLARISGTTSGSTVTVQNISGSALGNVNSAALVQGGANSILVVRTGQDTFNAFTAICTHEQCEITGFNSGTFVCPCHGSQYNTGGAVIQGPATQRLRQFTTSFTNNVLTITT